MTTRDDGRLIQKFSNWGRESRFRSRMVPAGPAIAIKEHVLGQVDCDRYRTHGWTPFVRVILVGLAITKISPRSGGVHSIICRWAAFGGLPFGTCRFTHSVADAPSFAGTGTSANASRYVKCAY
jgi:hypothetical protein